MFPHPLKASDSIFRVFPVLLALWAPLGLQAAAIPGIPQATTAPAKLGQPSVSTRISDVQALLNQARQDSATVESSLNHAANAPANAPADELQLRRYYLRETVRSYETFLRNIGLQSGLRQQLDQAKQQSDTWTALDAPPPHSVLLADNLRQDALSAQNRLKSVTSRQDLIGDLRDEISQAARTNAAAARLAEEQLSQAPDGQKAALAWSLEMTRQRLRAQSAILQSLEVAEENNQINIAIAQQHADLAQRKADSIKDRLVFSEEDYARVKSDLDAESRVISRKLSTMLDQASAATDKLSRARQALAQAEASLAANFSASVNGALAANNKPPASLDALRQEVLLAEQKVVSANTLLDGLRYAPTAFEIKRSMWDFRYRLYRDKSPETLAEAKLKLKNIDSVLALMVSINARQIANAANETLALEKLLTSIDSSVDRTFVRKQLVDLADREQELRLIGAFFASTRRLMDTLNIEMGGQASGFSPKEKLQEVSITGKDMFLTLWNYELFVAEDSIEVDGKKITGYSSITVGKVSRAILIFAIGVLLSLWLSRLAEAIVVRRFGFDAARAKILSKWFYTFGLLLLLVLVLTWVNIPLTVFAFLGGAVAIGLGFGMQNVLKNLISGLMLLFERPFKPGDLVEVGPLKGNVTEIGIRSSTIRDVNGVDTMIPNSLFVEQSVTNWTYDPKVRFCIKIGVAYGSPVREVAELLEECVHRHGLVLADPEPEVLFEDFGADSLSFGVYFWLALGPNVTGRRVASDLRFIIDKALSEKGIVIAYPQRDVHLDMAEPLKVEMVGK